MFRYLFLSLLLSNSMAMEVYKLRASKDRHKVHHHFKKESNEAEN